jgi:hypothetical protein
MPSSGVKWNPSSLFNMFHPVPSPSSLPFIQNAILDEEKQLLGRIIKIIPRAYFYIKYKLL